eukprot:GFUD01007683.1.p2 GENE.GFUD01007683.1~~GFUD01007683.1.p2  ORF type:complete len:137 (+),score=42.15 GFUD01007683.1:74-484(+)
MFRLVRKRHQSGHNSSYWGNCCSLCGFYLEKMTSLAFLKYCGNGFGEDKPVQVGDRVGLVRDLEKNVKGYKALRRELDMLKVVLEQQQHAREKSNMEKTMRTKYYKSQMGIRTVKSTGGTYFTYPVGRLGLFHQVM